MSVAAINRAQPPALRPITLPPLPESETVKLPGGAEIILLPYGTQPLAEIQFVFNAGHAAEPRNGVAPVAARMLAEGAPGLTSAEISRRFDFYGAYFNPEISVDYATISVSAMTKFLKPTLELATTLLKSASFPEEEFDALRQRLGQNLRVEEQKTGWQARRRFGELLFGYDHPYARNVGQAELSMLGLDELNAFHRERFNPSQCFVVAAGQFDRAELLDLFAAYFEGVELEPAAYGEFEDAVANERDLHIHKMPGQVQSTIRAGHVGFDRGHEDVYHMRLANIILGGYFGSRLMQNIREEKGFTYGIGSRWVSYKKTGYLTVGTDVANEYVKDTLDEIRKEMERMRQEKVGAEELEIARNYTLGKFAADMETPFQHADRLKVARVYGLPPDEYARSFEAIREATAEQLLDACQTHFKPEELLEVVCGDWSPEG